MRFKCCPSSEGLASDRRGTFHSLGDHVHGLLEWNRLPRSSVRLAVQNVLNTVRTRHELKGGCALGAKASLRDRRIGVTFNVGDAAVFYVDELTASDRAIRTYRSNDFVGGPGSGHEIASSLRKHALDCKSSIASAKARNQQKASLSHEPV